MKIAIYGIGNFGFAITRHLSETHFGDKKIKIFAYDRNHELITNLQKTRKHLIHHRQQRIRSNVTFTTSMYELIRDADVVVLTVSSDGVVEVTKEVMKYFSKPTIVLNTAKALEQKTAQPFSLIVDPILKNSSYPTKFAVISGGTIASDLFQQQPLGVDIASKSTRALILLKSLFTSDNLNVYTTHDVEGVEYAGAFKNIISILAGVINGLGYSYGSETHFITRAAFEIEKLVNQIIKVDRYTFSIHSQCWGNDMWMSCTGNTRNREFGQLIGSGMTPKQALNRMKKLNKNVEGVRTIRALKHFPYIKSFPVIYAIQKIILSGANPRKVVTRLMSSNNI